MISGVSFNIDFEDDGGSVAKAPPSVQNKVHEARKKRFSLGPLTLGYGDTEKAKKKPDFVFIVEGRRFPAHKDILCDVSKVFEKMFRGEFSSPSSTELLDTTASAASLFLQLIYEGTRSVAVTMSPRDSLECLKLANIYMVDKLERFLRTKLLRNITYKDVLLALPFSELNINDWSIRSKCWSIIERETARVINTEHFVNISWEYLCAILENSRLTVSEHDLFLAVKRWALKQKKSFGKSATLVDAIGVAIYKIRFPTMSPAEWRLVKNSGALRPKEIEDLEKNFRKNRTFPHEPRRNICMCRKKQLECILCFSNVTTSVKGASGNTPYQRNARMIRSPRRGSHTYDTPRVWVPPPSTNIATRMNSRFVTSRPPRHVIESRRLKSPATSSVCISVSSSPKRPRQIPTCECFKYKSCPAFPNGTTADILRKLGLQLVSFSHSK